MTTGRLRILRARSAYRRVFRLSSLHMQAVPAVAAPVVKLVIPAWEPALRMLAAASQPERQHASKQAGRHVHMHSAAANPAA